MTILAQIGDLRAAKVLDFGCGTGHMLEVLRRDHAFDGEYVGYDLAPELLAAARTKFPDARFEERDVLAHPPTEHFDYVLVSGVFNNALGDDWARMTTLLHLLYARARRGLAFNALSDYVDFYEPGLFYVSPEAVFGYCKQELSPLVSLRHDYQVKPGGIPFEFAVYVYATSVRPRLKRVAGSTPASEDVDRLI